MSVETATTFLALLAVLALVILAVIGVLTTVGRSVLNAIAPYVSAFRSLALPFAFCVALTCMLGSLYLSEVAKFPPCELCWFQRIAMYPLSLILLIAAIRRDISVRNYVVPIALVGLCISTYHYLLERFPDTVTYSCSTDVPCSTVWVWKFHFLSIPGMAGIGFALIAVLAMLAKSIGPQHSDLPGVENA